MDSYEIVSGASGQYILVGLVGIYNRSKNDYYN